MKERIELTKKRNRQNDLLNAIRNALKCVGKKDAYGPDFNYVLIDNDKLYCTDGHCCAIVDLPVDTYKSGFYIIDKIMKHFIK